jgi:hypothetical protein
VTSTTPEVTSTTQEVTTTESQKGDLFPPLQKCQFKSFDVFTGGLEA